MTTQQLEKEAKELLGTVMDPELNIDIVSLGLVYQVMTQEVQIESGTEWRIHVIMTLTTPGCPLAHVFDSLLKNALLAHPLVFDEQQITIELTFDPPWIPDMMTEEARAELDL